MKPETFYLLVADAILILHVLFVAFVVLGLIFIFLGKYLLWLWVRNPWFRATHLLGISVVVLQAWLGVICPLTTWEMSLRSKAGEAIYEVSFIAHWLSELLYYQASPWVFVVCYTFFGGLVLASWFLVRPRAF
jgi:glucan phosphoethanolaminetransferase (alkaline phosphatase superfamily)